MTEDSIIYIEATSFTGETLCLANARGNWGEGICVLYHGLNVQSCMKIYIYVSISHFGEFTVNGVFVRFPGWAVVLVSRW